MLYEVITNETKEFPGVDNLFVEGKSSFEFLKPLQEYEGLVDFKSINFSKAKDGVV